MGNRRKMQQMCDDTTNCNCRTVVTRVYRELRDRNIPDPSAFDTAARIFRLHHPETRERDARHTIANWLD
jgi:hypothetical protein